MTTPNLARIERVSDLRATWPNEAQHFTPWLAENIAELGEALGMDLELQQTEASVGGYSLDILATDLNGSRPVIIENQLEITDHTHLGQLLTYASGFDAGVVVWVTREFRDEHRQALDWLNQRTGEDTQFFGVEVELWRIGDSPPAPHFKLAATPNGWRKSKINSLASNLITPRQQQNIDFRQSLIDTLRRDYGINPRAQNRPVPATWLVIEYPIRSVRYVAIWHRGRPGMEMVIERGGLEGGLWTQRMYEALEKQRTEIESSLSDTNVDESFNWEPSQDGKRSRIAIYKSGNFYNDTESLDELREWMIAKLLKFRAVFGPRLTELSS